MDSVELTRLILRIEGLVISFVSAGCCRRLGEVAASVNAASVEEVTGSLSCSCQSSPRVW